MADNKINVGGRLHSIATGNILAGADEILDDNIGKKQSEVNIDVDNALADRYTKGETYNKNQLNNLITTPNQEYVTVEDYASLPESGEANTIYRVSNWDGSLAIPATDITKYSEYAWDGSQYIFLCVKSQIGEVFDISAANSGTTYADLAEALGTNGTNVPVSVRKGGMSIKFVQTSDNKYVQYRYMLTDVSTDTTFTNVNNWSFYEENVLVENKEFIEAWTDEVGHLLFWLRKDGGVDWAIGVPKPVKDYTDSIIETKVDKIEGKGLSTNDYTDNDKDIVDTHELVENPEFMYVEIDDKEKVLNYRDKNGILHENAGIETPNANIGNINIKENATFEAGVPQQIIDYINSHQQTISYAPYQKNHAFGIIPASKYEGYQEDYSWGDINTYTSGVYAKYDELVISGYSTSEVIGQASDNQDIKLYTFGPLLTDAPNGFVSGIPTIMIICGQHGFEKNSAYGLYYFLKDVIEHSDSNELLRYFKKNVRFIVVPVANPSGWDSKDYKNSNGVNLNRNWWVPNWTQSIKDSTSDQYGGVEPFDQPETAAIRDYILAHVTEIDLFIDNHTNGSGVVAHNQDINWCDFTSCADTQYAETDFYNGMKKMIFAHTMNISSIINEKYGQYLKQNETSQCSHITYNPHMTKGWADSYAITQGILGMCFEVFNGFPEEQSSYSDRSKQCVSILDCSLFANFCDFYSKFN